jgi:acyl-coenzyme A thioesterase PaaI-like protein
MQTDDLTRLIDVIPFAAALGIQILDVKPGNVTATMDWARGT